MTVSAIARRTGQTDPWQEVSAHLGEFRSAVVTGLDAQGFPLSLRCHPQPDEATRTLRIGADPGLPLQPGAASLLCHSHDEQLWNQKSFLLRGRIVRGESDGIGWFFEPVQYIEGVGYGGLVGLVRFVVTSRRAARAYLAKRGLARPNIPWSDVLAAKQAAKQSVKLSRPAQPIPAALVAAGIVAALGALGAVLLIRRRPRR